jgi:hypothetical protein
MADLLTLSSGATVPCRVVSTTDQHVVIEYQAGTGIVATRREVPWSEVATVDWAMDETFQRFITAPDPARDLAPMAAQWQSLQPLLGRPHHPAGDLGLTLANLWLRSGAEKDLAQAAEAARLIGEKDWNPARRQGARLITARVLWQQKQPAQARPMAEGLLREPGLDPAVAAEAHLLLASDGYRELLALEAEHPRWMEDDQVRPRREELFHESLDHALKPCLFYGTGEGSAAAGLLQAARLHEHGLEVEAAAACARDILLLYPATPAAEDARKLLTRHQLPLAPPAVATAAPESSPPAPSGENPAMKPPAEPAADNTPQVTRRPRRTDSSETPVPRP